MTHIQTILPKDAEGRLAALYERVRGPDGRVDNILVAHSLRPHTLEGHMALYKAALHHSANALPKALLETIGVYVSLLNGCAYCVNHHFVGIARHLKDDARASKILAALRADRPDDPVFDARERAALSYARKLARDCARMGGGDIAALRKAGFDDGEILEINQVAAYFAYANRTVLGLGVTTEGDALGHSPGGGDEDWGHQ